MTKNRRVLILGLAVLLAGMVYGAVEWNSVRERRAVGAEAFEGLFGRTLMTKGVRVSPAVELAFKEAIDQRGSYDHYELETVSYLPGSDAVYMRGFTERKGARFVERVMLRPRTRLIDKYRCTPVDPGAPGYDPAWNADLRKGF